MSSEPPEPPERWRALALEARNVAAQMTDLEAKLVMLSIARIYERLAVLAQAREQKKISTLANDVALTHQAVPRLP